MEMFFIGSRFKRLQTAKFVVNVVLVFFLFACQKGASDANQAKQRLLGVKSWAISEIYVDDVIRLKEGKLITDFGGVDFGRYMDRATFTKDGFFIGYFRGESIPLKLRYVIKSEYIVLSDANPAVKGGEWLIAPSGVAEDSFEMYTTTQAYNYPATTTVRLLFKKSE